MLTQIYDALEAMRKISGMREQKIVYRATLAPRKQQRKDFLYV